MGEVIQQQDVVFLLHDVLGSDLLHRLQVCNLLLIVLFAAKAGFFASAIVPDSIQARHYVCQIGQLLVTISVPECVRPQVHAPALTSSPNYWLPREAILDRSWRHVGEEAVSCLLPHVESELDARCPEWKGAEYWVQVNFLLSFLEQ
jgi:hypothetical protein